MRSVLLFLAVAAFAVSADEPVIDTSCIFDPAEGAFRAYTADDRNMIGQTLMARPEMILDKTVVLDGMRFEMTSMGRDVPEVLNYLLDFAGEIEGVRFYALNSDEYAGFRFAIGDAGTCNMAVYQYRPELHFAWMEKHDPLWGFVFKHPALAVDPASFKRNGPLVRGIGFEMLGHPHKLEDGTQPMYNRTHIEVNCESAEIRVLAQRTYGPEYQLISHTPGSEKWYPAKDVYYALMMLAAAMCDVPPEAWNEDTRLPGDIHEFSKFVHFKAHEKS